MEKVFNFSSGPATLPPEVTERAAREFVNYNDCGMSIFELNKAGGEYGKIAADTEKLLRELLSVPQNYKVIFMQGNSATQHSAIPLNLLTGHKCVDYIISGQFSKNASLEAKKYGDVALAATSAGASPAFSTIPETSRNDFRPDADYIYICFNNTVYGTKYHYIPDTGNIPLVADMTSFLLSEPIEVSKFALIYAATEAGIGVAGMTVAIVRDDLISSGKTGIPDVLNYKLAADVVNSKSKAPLWSLYMFKLMLEWIKERGGLEEMKRRNEKKASLIYDYLDGQSYYTASVDKKCRSMMNVVFCIGESALDAKFKKEAAAEGLYNLDGHSSVGGMCASLYDAMPYEGVERLVSFMKRFAQENPKLDT